MSHPPTRIDARHRGLRRAVPALLAGALVVAVGCADKRTEVTGGDASSAPSTAAAAAGTTVGTSRGAIGVQPGGGSGGLGRLVPEATPAYLAAAAARTSEVTSGAFTLTVGLSGGQGLLDGDLLKADGAFETASARSRMTLDGGAVGGTGEIVTVGDTTYVKTDGLGRLLTGGRAIATPWISITGAAGGGRAASVVPFVGTGGARSMLSTLRGAGGQVREAGTDTVDGVAVTHYTGTIDPAAATAADPTAGGALAQLGTGPIPVEAWVDADGIVRRLELQPDLAGASGLGGLGAIGALGGDDPGSTPRLTLAVELRDIGQPVTIDVPPADQVTPVDPTSLSGPTGGLGGAGGLGGTGGLGG
ncbi:MAG: hypothetical protein U0Q07_14370 [Acidimicrobiales bacterium]